MKRKIVFLIVGCIITVAALAVIQGYFIYNTYKLNAKEANSAITQQYLKLETSGKLDTLNFNWMSKTNRFVEDYYLKKVTKKDFEKLIKKTSDSLSNEVNKFITKENLVGDYDVSYSNYITSVVMCIDTTRKFTDTIYKGKLLLFGNNYDNNPEIPASQSTWNANTTDMKNLDIDKDIMFQVVSARYYSIANWQQQVFLKMWGLLTFSVALLIFVVVLFYLSIKGLIMQKKIADIKTDFINNITHEFQTPLAALDIAIKTLKNKGSELTPEQFGHSLDIINRQNKRMQKLFSQVTQASVLENETSTEKARLLTATDIQEIIDDFTLSHQDISLHFEGNGTLYMDKFHLVTIMMNLLDNAVKYGGDRIEVNLHDNTLSVKDNGIGIAQKEQKVIFEKFYRVQKGNIHNTKGLGLGLYYICQLIKTYKGEIAVNSEEGNGAEFIITIPKP